MGSSGFHLALAARCQSRVIDVWCSPSKVANQSAAGPCSTPPTLHKEEVACPRELDFKSVQVSIRAPWGRVYRAMSDANGVVDIPVDWAATGVDPLAESAAEQLSTGWLVYSDEARALPLKLEPADVERMQAAIGAATDTQYEVGAANEKATLTAELGGGPALVLGQEGAISLAITNSGPQPAYRVIAKLRSSVDALHGHQLSFGRIDPGKTKIRTRAIVLPLKLEERSALVAAEITFFNGDRIGTKKRFNIVPGAKRPEAPREPGPEAKPAAPLRMLTMDCKLLTPEVAPGERVRLDCELRNRGFEPLSELGIIVSIGGVASKNLAPKSMQGGGSEKLELIGLTSANAKQGVVLPVVVLATALGLPPVARTLSVRLASFATKCQKRLTRDEYKVKRKRLQAALDSGALTQKEFDKYDADLVDCLQ